MYLFKLEFYLDICPGVGLLDHVLAFLYILECLEKEPDRS